MIRDHFTDLPWQAQMETAGARLWTYIPERGGVVVATFNTSHVLRDHEKKANARRAAACVNFCAGLTTEQIEAMLRGGVKAVDAVRFHAPSINAIGF